MFYREGLKNPLSGCEYDTESLLACICCVLVQWAFFLGVFWNQCEATWTQAKQGAEQQPLLCQSYSRFSGCCFASALTPQLRTTQPWIVHPSFCFKLAFVIVDLTKKFMVVDFTPILLLFTSRSSNCQKKNCPLFKLSEFYPHPQGQRMRDWGGGTERGERAVYLSSLLLWTEWKSWDRWGEDSEAAEL